MKYVIYKIVCNNIEVEYTYVGSTKDFSNRMRLHKFDSKREIKAHMKIYKIINDHGGWDNWHTDIIETCVCESKAEAVTIETKYYDELNASLNTYRPMLTTEERKEYKDEQSKHYRNNNPVTIKQYLTANKEAIKDYHKQYRTANKKRLE